MFCLVNKKSLYLRSINFYESIDPCISWTTNKSECLKFPDFRFVSHFTWIIYKFYKGKLEVERYE